MSRLLCWGMTSHIPHTDKNVVFLDYDYTSLKGIARIAKRLQEKYSLGTVHIAHTGKKRHHVVFLDELDLDTWVKVVEESECHDGYAFHLKGQGYAILRLIKKGRNAAPRWLCSIPPKHPSAHNQSTTHAMLLHKFWELPNKCMMLGNLDKNHVWESVYYFTDNVRQTLQITSNANS